MRWTDGFVFALTMPAALIATVGYSIGVLGTWAAITLWGVSMLLATATNWLYSELASMFPEKLGGISLYAFEGWRRYLSLVGPVATFGYWFAWSSSIAIYAEIVGSLAQEEWFPGQQWVVHSSVVDITFPRVVAAGLVFAIWAVNVAGLRPTLWMAYATAAMLMVPLIVFMVLTYVTGDWSSSTFTWKLGEAGQDWGGWKLAFVWLYIMCWTSLGVETCATFAPEYRGGARDASRALRVSALFSLAVFVLLPLGAAGTVGEPAVAEDPVTFYVAGFDDIVGGAAGVMIALMIGSLLLVMNTCMADSSRTLFGASQDRLTIRELGRLNRFGVPGRAMTVDLVVNLALVFFVGSILAIVAAGNLGYILCHVLAVSAFVLLRRDRPGWPREIRLPGVAVPLAAALAVALAFLLVVGAANFELAGYGGAKELGIALGILGVSILLFLVRRLVQDGEPIGFRDQGPGAESALGTEPS
jgi:amino acid transporter